MTHFACMEQNLHLSCGQYPNRWGTSCAGVLAWVLSPLPFLSDSLNTREKNITHVRNASISEECTSEMETSEGRVSLQCSRQYFCPFLSDLIG
jgi:hypothetical protein